jgi:hypothetical protein
MHIGQATCCHAPLRQRQHIGAKVHADDLPLRPHCLRHALCNSSCPRAEIQDMLPGGQGGTGDPMVYYRREPPIDLA